MEDGEIEEKKKIKNAGLREGIRGKNARTTFQKAEEEPKSLPITEIFDN